MQGIVVSPKYKVMKNGGAIFEKSYIDHEDLRKYITYWDNIDFPDNDKYIFERKNKDYKLLISEKVMQRTFFKMNSFTGDYGTAFKEMQYRTLVLNNKRKNQIWSLAQPQQELVLEKKDLIEARTLNVELHNSLPVPNREVPIERILEFKYKRSSELAAFRGVMNDFYQEIINSIDSEHSLQTKINRIELSLKDLNKVMDESYLDRVQRSMSARLDIGKAVSAFAGTVGLSYQGLYPMSVGIIGGITAATFAGVRCSAEVLFKPRNIPDELKPYAYLSEVNKLNK